MTTPKLSKDVTIYHCSENVRLSLHLKGQCHEIFDFWFFSWISFPLSPKYTIRAVSNFFSNFAEIFTAQGAPPVSLTTVSTTLAKLVAKFAAGVVDTSGAPWLVNISANFRKNSKRSLLDTLGLGWNWFMKKTRSEKSPDTVPLTLCRVGRGTWWGEPARYSSAPVPQARPGPPPQRRGRLCQRIRGDQGCQLPR